MSDSNTPANTVRIELLPEHPRYGTTSDARDAGLAPARTGDAGIDLIACEDLALPPGGRGAVLAHIHL